MGYIKNVTIKNKFIASPKPKYRNTQHESLYIWVPKPGWANEFKKNSLAHLFYSINQS